MTIQADEHERTLAFAELALGQIKALRLPATPRHFEIWYAYATGCNPALNQKINETLSRAGTLGATDFDDLHEILVAATRVTGGIEDARSQTEIEQVMAMIGAAASTAPCYSESLPDVAHRFGHTADEPAVRAIVETLVHATKDMEKSNKTLEERLSASKQEITQLQHSVETARNESLTDPLTSLPNRKCFDERIAQAFDGARYRHEPMSLMMTDVDNFKRFNDSYGHLTGDQVLKLVALSIRQNVKGQDIAARYGGEEFAIILPNTVLRSAITVADHIRRAVMTNELMKRSTGEHLGRITISIGVAALLPGDTVQTLIERADNCLYAAKRNGRNRVISEVDPEVSSPPPPAREVAPLASAMVA